MQQQPCDISHAASSSARNQPRSFIMLPRTDSLLLIIIITTTDSGPTTPPPTTANMQDTFSAADTVAPRPLCAMRDMLRRVVNASPVLYSSLLGLGCCTGAI